MYVDNHVHSTLAKTCHKRETCNKYEKHVCHYVHNTVKLRLWVKELLASPASTSPPNRPLFLANYQYHFSCSHWALPWTFGCAWAQEGGLASEATAPPLYELIVQACVREVACLPPPAQGEARMRVPHIQARGVGQGKNFDGECIVGRIEMLWNTLVRGILVSYYDTSDLAT